MRRENALAALALAFCLTAGFAAAEPRILAITGKGSVPYTPDYVDLDFAVVTKDPSYAAAQNKNLASVEAVMTALTKGYSIQKTDVKSLDYRLAEDIVYEEGRQKSSGYVSTTRMRLRVRDLGSYRAIIVSLLDSGVNSIESISFGVEDPEALREKALVAAYADAERMAKSLAAAARASLGRVLSLRESGADRPEPLMLTKAAFRADAASNGEVISSGAQVYETGVYIEFELR
jgi:uncharacterized protein YggE